MSFLTTVDIAERLEIKPYILKNFVQSDRRALSFFRKDYVTTYIYSHRYGREIEKERFMWGFSEEKLPEFAKFWESKELNTKMGRPHTNHDALLSWTDTAKECYKRRMQCAVTCSSYEYCKELKKMNNNIPPIKDKVLELYAKLGKPIGE